MDGFWDLVGIKDGPLSKNLAVKLLLSRILEHECKKVQCKKKNNFIFMKMG